MANLIKALFHLKNPNNTTTIELNEHSKINLSGKVFNSIVSAWQRFAFSNILPDEKLLIHSDFFSLASRMNSPYFYMLEDDWNKVLLNNNCILNFYTSASENLIAYFTFNNMLYVCELDPKKDVAKYLVFQTATIYITQIIFPDLFNRLKKSVSMISYTIDSNKKTSVVAKDKLGNTLWNINMPALLPGVIPQMPDTVIKAIKKENQAYKSRK